MFDASCNHVYMNSSIAQDKSALVQIDGRPAKRECCFKSERADATDIIFNARTFEPEAACVDPGRQEMDGFDTRGRNGA